MYGRRSIRWQLRTLVTAICVLMLLGIAVTVMVLRSESGKVVRGTTVIGPARDGNEALLQAVVDAEVALATFRTTRDPARAARFAAARESVGKAQGRVRDQLRHKDLAPDQRREYAGLRAGRDGALAGWLYYADREYTRAVTGLPGDPATGATLFDRFRTAHTALSTKLATDYQALRQADRDVVPTVTLVALVATAFALLGSMVMSRLTSRSLTEPIASLRTAVHRLRAGDRTVVAVEDRGAREVRELAAAFNTLTAHNNELMAAQTENIRLHEVALEIEYATREAVTLQSALDGMCERLGPALRVDRLVVSLLDEAGYVTRGAQWHTSGMATFPPDVSPHAGSVAHHLWTTATNLVVTDAHDWEVPAWLEPYHREAGARAILVVPIGLAEHVRGTLSAHVLETPREWTGAEIGLLHHAAAFLAHTIAQAEYRSHQTDHVARLERIDQQKTEFLSTVSHELRTPLTSISGYLELLVDGAAGEVNEDQTRMLEVIDRNAARLRSLIEDLLVMGGVESDALRLTTGNVPMAEVLEQTVEELQPNADKGGVTVCLRTENALVYADRVYLQRALLNVIANAIKFTPRGGTVSVTQVVHPDTGEVAICCTDTGIGIPAADLDRLTTRFFRASNATRATIPGTGLGLSIVKAVVEAHRGDLEIVSAEGRGTTVILRFPAVLSQAVSTR